MRLRFLIFIVISVLAIFPILFLLSSTKSKKITGASSETVQPATKRLDSSPSDSIASNAPTEVVLPSKPQPEQSNQKKIKEAQETYENFNKNHNTPIEFYGKVIDQDSNPIAGVKVDFEISQTFMASPTNLAFVPSILRLKKETGIDGRFEIIGEKGEGVDIESIQKDGYEAEPVKHSHGNLEGSFSDPIIFKMWSTNIHEHLITGGKSFHIVPDGRPYFINLAADTISETATNADLKVWIQYTNQVVRGQLYDWSTEIDVINGGLQETKDYSMFLAPPDGYVPSFAWKNQIKGGQRGSIGERRFYLKLKNGEEYGHMIIELHAPFNDQIPGLINLSYVINPSGSHILR